MSFILQNEHIAAFDVDDTLILWDEEVKDIYINCPYTGKSEAVTKHKQHINQIIKNKARGSAIIVWSAAGYKWAEAVVKALELEEYVDLILSKPIKFFDDMPAEQVLVNRVYLEYKK